MDIILHHKSCSSIRLTPQHEQKRKEWSEKRENILQVHALNYQLLFAMPSTRVNLDYFHDKYKPLARSRQSNPALPKPNQDLTASL